MFMQPQPQPQPQQQIIKYKPQDLNFFKNVILAFVIGRLASISANIFIDSLVGSLIDIGATIILIFGIYKISQEYTELHSGVKVALLFGGVLGVNVLSTFYDYLNPLSVNTNTTSTQDSINQLKMIVNYFYVIIFFTVISGVFTVMAAYYLTEWFNLGFSNKMTQIKAFFYYGIIFCVGQGLLAIAFLAFNFIATGIINTGFATQSDINNLNTVSNIGNAGTLVILAGLIAEIIAGIKIYNRVNDYFTGKYFYRPYYASYQQPYPGNPYQQPYQGNPYQQTYQGNPYQQPYQNNPYQQPYQGTVPQPQNNFNSQQNSQDLPQSEEEVSSINDTYAPSNDPPKNLICKNCSMPLPPQTKFCFRCGQKVE